MGTMEFINQAAKDATDIYEIEKKAYYMRAGDQSFYGIGIPSVAVRAYIPVDSPHRGQWIGGSGGAWWWHSAYDTLDKGDRNHLLRDLRMEVLTIIRSVNAQVLPFDFTEVAQMYEDTVTKIQTQTASGIFNLNVVLDTIREMKTMASQLNEKIPGFKGDTNALNDTLVEATRILTSLYYTYTGPFDQDPAYGISFLSALQRAPELASLNPESNKARFLKTRLFRERNKVVKAIESAIKLIEQAIDITS